MIASTDMTKTFLANVSCSSLRTSWDLAKSSATGPSAA